MVGRIFSENLIYLSYRGAKKSKKNVSDGQTDGRTNIWNCRVDFLLIIYNKMLNICNFLIKLLAKHLTKKEDYIFQSRIKGLSATYQLFMCMLNFLHAARHGFVASSFTFQYVQMNNNYGC